MAVWLKYCIPLLSLWLLSTVAEIRFHEQCKESSCGIHEPPIRFPFRIKGRQPEWCAYNSSFDLHCTYTNHTVLQLSPSVKAFVKSIDYSTQLMNVSLSYPQGCLQKSFNFSASPFGFNHDVGLVLFNCSVITSYTNTDHSDIIAPGNFSCLNVPGFQVIAVDFSSSLVDMPVLSCTRIQSLLSLPDSVLLNNNVTGLSWFQPDCKNCERNGGQCKIKENNTKHEFHCMGTPTGSSKWKLLAGILGPFLLVSVGVIAYYLYIAVTETRNYTRFRRFLEDYKADKPARYSFADIKRITNQFKEELGQGAFGTVFKGKLSNEIQVAVKVLLNTSTGNGQEFINEMETMCQIHHVNVARLVGFCADGFNRALVYEFLPNGSLQNFISSADNKDAFLGWEKLQNIALGVAKGIEYLHQGCDKRILHFDIKPHNVLLDNNFIPKISDFGLAKLCSKDQSIVSMTTARGTLGYIAPEVFSRNFGSVSYKSDVYSYGMLLLEMVGGRKVTGVSTENSNHVYYPQWIYNLLENNEDITIHIEGEDARVAKKLSIVGLWCIQWHPINRPTMKAVIQMLEGDGENLEMPPNPFSSTSAASTSNRGGTGRLIQELDVISEIE